MTDSDRETLYDRGNVYVTHAAARAYADARRMEPEPARRELTAVLLDAVCTDETPPSRWRRRDARVGVDVTARVTPDPDCPDLLVVVSVSVRPYKHVRTLAEQERRARRRIVR